MSYLDEYLKYADDPTPKPQSGEWTLIAPNGRKWVAGSPIGCCTLESRDRIPPKIALGRIAHAMNEEKK